MHSITTLLLGLLQMAAIVSALQLPASLRSERSLSSSIPISRRTAVSNLIASSTASSTLLNPKCVLANELASPPNAIALNSQNEKGFPLASFGLQIYSDDVAYKLTLTALSVGYRNFFASVLAGNQRGFARAIKDSGIPRDELYIWYVDFYCF